MKRRLLIVLCCLVGLTMLAEPARATWSIVVFDRRTGQIGVASATCLNSVDLENVLPVVIVGVGAACAQSAIDVGAVNRQFIHKELLEGTPPEVILELLDDFDNQHRQRQYGIVDGLHAAGTFTGSRAGAYAGGISGQVGDLSYAIQGNVITGPPVVLKAEEALLSTPGDLPEKLMAAMEAAMRMGGDGRCSCNNSEPDGCGSPPSEFDKSAHIAFLVVARLGDRDGQCGPGGGCARGDYFLNLNLPFQASSNPDPVLGLRKMFEEWRVTQFGRPDGVSSLASFDRHALPADGSSEAVLHIVARDFLDRPLRKGGATVDVQHADDSTGSSSVVDITDRGDGTYDVRLRAGIRTGRDVFEVVLDDGLGREVTLAPFPSIEILPPPLGPKQPLRWIRR
ncbi:MAG: DUF1028 domain-containing protein [Planctomycetota bacterium]